MQMPNTSSPVYSQIDGEEPKTTFSSITIRFGDDCSEPVIGPGMILERGRTRVVILSIGQDCAAGYCRVHLVRKNLIGWWSSVLTWAETLLSVHEIRENVRDGNYRVIRPADTQAKEPPCQK